MSKFSAVYKFSLYTALNDTEGAAEFNPTPEVLRAKLEKQGSQESLESNASSQASLLKRSQESLQVLSYHSSQSSLDKHPSKKVSAFVIF